VAVVPFDRVVLETLALSDVGVAFTAERHLDAVLDRLLGTTLQVVRADTGSVMLLSRERDTLVVVAARMDDHAAHLLELLANQATILMVVEPDTDIDHVQSKI
jgi:hypothetical protein